MPSVFETYCSRFEVFAQQSHTPVNKNLGIIITIPCYYEPEIVRTLDSICHCAMPKCSVEILVVVNHSESAENDIKAFNQKTLEMLHQYAEEHATEQISIVPIAAFDIPQKQAGVGYARKVAMDEAIHRFAQINNPNGILVSCDADTLVETNYLTAIEQFYEQHPQCGATNLYFEHPLSGELQQEQYQAIAQYELYLRYYVEQLKRIGFPYAYHTVGSCFSVRAKAYCRQGGMNKRQAGEDFYFLQKLFPSETFGEITSTTVYPSSRVSNRVPFGTGTAIAELKQQGGELQTYPSESFDVLQQFFSQSLTLCNATESQLGKTYETFHPCLKSFLQFTEFKEKIIEIQHNTKSKDQFQKRFFRWFNGFQVYKFLNHSALLGFPKENVVALAAQLLQSNNNDVMVLLQHYRNVQKSSKQINSVSS